MLVRKGKMKKLLITTGLVLAMASPALAESSKANVQDHYKWVSKRVPHTHDICEIVNVPIYGNKGMNTEGAIIGGIIGGVIGNNIGKGGGKDTATGVGALTGAIIGGGAGKKEVVGYEQVEKCKTVTEYTVTNQEVYSHSTVTFWHDGKKVTLSFQK